jgi:protein-S-isoprenylcysteine O-methyltransferase Ste14
MSAMEGGSILRVWLPLLVGLYVLGVLYGYGPGPHDGLRILGLCLALAGLAGVILARYTLGRSFSVKAKATALVTSGIYSRIRNPIYVSGIVFVTGAFLILRESRLWIVLPIVIVMQILRARREARVLEAAFGDSYREYRRRTWL